MDGLSNKGTDSRAISLADTGDFIGTINDWAPTIIKLMGVTYSDGSFSYTDAEYKSFLLNQQIYRSSMEQALKMMKLGKLTKEDIESLNFDTSTLVKYALAVFVTEHDAFWRVEYSGLDTTPSSVIVAYLNANPKLGLGTLAVSDELTEPDSSTTGLDYGNWPAFVKASDLRKSTDEGLAYFKAILENIVIINDFGGIAQISTELNEFLDDTTDGFDKFYSDLMSN